MEQNSDEVTYSYTIQLSPQCVKCAKDMVALAGEDQFTCPECELKIRLDAGDIDCGSINVTVICETCCQAFLIDDTVVDEVHFCISCQSKVTLVAE